MPDILGAAPQVIRGIFSSGITTGLDGYSGEFIYT